MIPLDRIKACSHPECRAVLPADPDDEPNAGFWVSARERGPGSRPRRWQSRCKECVREANRVRAGIRRRGEPYAPRPALSPQRRSARTRKRRRRFAELRAQHAERMRTDAAYARAYRARGKERKRRVRRRAGVAPRWPKRRSEGLPAAPLIAWLRAETARRGKTAVARAGGLSYDRVRVLCQGYYLHNLRSGETRRYEIRRVTLDLAERLVEGNGGSLDEVWPDGLV